jgi:PIN domain nuclease of toxin-antitoxin system
MVKGLTDTHAVLWYLFGDPRLSSKAKAFLDTMAGAGDQVGLATITLAEIVYLIEKGRIPADRFARVLAVLDMPNGLFVEIPFDRQIAEALRRVDRVKVPDLPDRIIAATALHLEIPLLSRDAKIQASGIMTIW